MSNILSLILRNLIEASISIGIIYVFRFLYNMNKREVISLKKSLKKEYVGDYIILSTKLSLASLSCYHFFRCINSILSVNNLIDSNIFLEVIALFIFLSFIPILYIYIVIIDLKENYI